MLETPYQSQMCYLFSYLVYHPPFSLVLVTNLVIPDSPWHISLSGMDSNLADYNWSPLELAVPFYVPHFYVTQFLVGLICQYGFFSFLLPWCPISDGRHSVFPTLTFPLFPNGIGCQYDALTLLVAWHFCPTKLLLHFWCCPHWTPSFPSIPVGDGFQYGALELFPIGGVCPFGWSTLICRILPVEVSCHSGFFSFLFTWCPIRYCCQSSIPTLSLTLFSIGIGCQSGALIFLFDCNFCPTERLLCLQCCPHRTPSSSKNLTSWFFLPSPPYNSLCFFNLMNFPSRCTGTFHLLSATLGLLW